MSDQVWITLITTLGYVGTAGVTVGVTMWFQSKRENTARAIEAEREKARQLHELHRDQHAKQYEFTLQQYREQREACSALVAATQQFQVMAISRYTVREVRNHPPRPGTPLDFDPAAEAALSIASEERAATYSAEAMKLLRVDEDAARVVALYQALPRSRLLNAPKDADARREWQDAVAALQQAIFDYLRLKREALA